MRKPSNAERQSEQPVDDDRISRLLVYLRLSARIVVALATLATALATLAAAAAHLLGHVF
jgi:hypothetical protein